jgi:hypothetical protein
VSAERIDHPFSNGSESMDWQLAWCDGCIHDHTMHGPDGEGGCPLFLRAFMGDTPLVWQPYEQDWWRTIPAGIDCRAFEQCVECGPPEKRGGQTRREACGLGDGWREAP